VNKTTSEEAGLDRVTTIILTTNNCEGVTCYQRPEFIQDNFEMQF